MLRVGDIITGLPNNDYGITSSDAIMVVTNVMYDEITVLVIDHKCKSEIGGFYNVEPHRFRKFEDVVNFDNYEKVMKVIKKQIGKTYPGGVRRWANSHNICSSRNSLIFVDSHFNIYRICLIYDGRDLLKSACLHVKLTAKDYFEKYILHDLSNGERAIEYFKKKKKECLDS